jgi:hypothetical protein
MRYYVITVSGTGVSIRYNNTLVSYSFCNFNPPKNDLLYIGESMGLYQKRRWNRFFRLALKIMQNVDVIKNGKVIFSKRGSL